MDVPGLHPNDTDTWRTSPTSCHPDVSVAIPPLVSSNPDITWSGSDTNHAYSDRRRWRNPNHRRLRTSDNSAQQQCPAKRKSDASAIHFMISLQNLMHSI